MNGLHSVPIMRLMGSETSRSGIVINLCTTKCKLKSTTSKNLFEILRIWRYIKYQYKVNSQLPKLIEKLYHTIYYVHFLLDNPKSDNCVPLLRVVYCSNLNFRLEWCFAVEEKWRLWKRRNISLTNPLQKMRVINFHLKQFCMSSKNVLFVSAESRIWEGVCSKAFEFAMLWLWYKT